MVQVQEQQEVMEKQEAVWGVGAEAESGASA